MKRLRRSRNTCVLLVLGVLLSTHLLLYPLVRPGLQRQRFSLCGQVRQDSGGAEVVHRNSSHSRGTSNVQEVSKVTIEKLPLSTSNVVSRNAYVVLISNEKYVDGALVLGWSLRNVSQAVAQGRADLVLMLTKGIGEPSRERLSDVGYRLVAINQSLSSTNPRSAWRDTLNKLYLFNLTDYAKIAFFDADMIAFKNPDSMFNISLPGPDWVAAIGWGKYFATGVMVLRPSTEICKRIVDFYLTAASNKSDTRGFKGYNARDGLVFRWFIGPRHLSLDQKYSYHMTGRGPVHGVMLHFRGGWKPWYNRHWAGREVAHLHKDLQGTLDFGTAYRLWWKIYRDMHLRLWQNKPFTWGTYGGKAPLPNGSNPDLPPSPSTHFWINRYTAWEYLKPINESDT